MVYIRYHFQNFGFLGLFDTASLGSIPVYTVVSLFFFFSGMVWWWWKTVSRSGPISLGPIPPHVLEGIFSSANVTLVVSDSAGCILWVNPHFFRQTGYSPEEVKGKRPGDFLQGPLTRETDIRRFREGLQSGQAFETEILNYHKSGHTYTIEALVAPLRDSGGVIRHFISVQRDVTVARQQSHAYHASLEALRTSMQLARRYTEAFFLEPGPLPASHFRGFYLSEVREEVSSTFVLYRERGESRWLLFGGNPMKGAPAAVFNMVISHALEQHLDPELSPDELVSRVFSSVWDMVKQGRHALPDTTFDLACLRIEPGPGSGNQVAFSSNRLCGYVLSPDGVQSVEESTQGHSLAGFARTSFLTHRWETAGRHTFFFWNPGVTEQVGGILGKKYGRKSLHRFLANLAQIPVEFQSESLKMELDAWRGPKPLAEDLLVLGFQC